MKRINTLLLIILLISCTTQIKNNTNNIINEETYCDTQKKDRWFIKKADERLGFIDSLGQEIFSDHFSMLR